jgi:hypothetical protein
MGRSLMRKKQKDTANDPLLLPNGEDVTAEQLDNASVKMLQSYTDVGLQCFAEQCRHWQAMAEIELERRNHSSRRNGC